MDKRFNMQEMEPAGYNGMYAFSNSLAASTISKTHKDLIKIRASQINSCAFCIDMHTKEAIKNGETLQRIFLLNAWRETDLFTEEEKAVLAMTEEITLIHQQGLTSETYKKAEQFFDKKHIAQLIMAIVNINAWNRVAISTHLEVPK